MVTCFHSDWQSHGLVWISPRPDTDELLPRRRLHSSCICALCGPQQINQQQLALLNETRTEDSQTNPHASVLEAVRCSRHGAAGLGVTSGRLTAPPAAVSSASIVVTLGTTECRRPVRRPQLFIGTMCSQCSRHGSMFRSTTVVVPRTLC